MLAGLVGVGDAILSLEDCKRENAAALPQPAEMLMTLAWRLENLISDKLVAIVRSPI